MKLQARLFLLAAVGLFLLNPYWHHLAHEPIVPCPGHFQGPHITLVVESDGHDCMACLLTLFFIPSIIILAPIPVLLAVSPSRSPIHPVPALIRIGSRAPPR